MKKTFLAFTVLLSIHSNSCHSQTMPPVTVRTFNWAYKMGAVNAKGDTIIPVKCTTVSALTDSIFLVSDIHKHLSYINLAGDSLSIPQPELKPAGRNWKEVQESYAEKCDCNNNAKINKSAAIEIAKEKGYYAEGSMDYNSSVWIIKYEGKCTWYIDTFIEHGDNRFHWSSGKSIWIDMKTGEVLKKEIGPDTEKERNWEK